MRKDFLEANDTLLEIKNKLRLLTVSELSEVDLNKLEDVLFEIREDAQDIVSICDLYIDGM